MSLRDKLGKSRAGLGAEGLTAMFARYGIRANPFPPAGQPSGHAHLETKIDADIVHRIEAFDRDKVSQVVLIEGTQGVGKTNLLSYYEQQLEDAYKDEPFYVIRYETNPETSFDGILRKLFQELGPDHLVKLGKSLSELDTSKRESIIDASRGYDVRVALLKLAKTHETGDDQLSAVAAAMLEWLIGLRLLKKHREHLGVQYRLDTVESKMQALRDIVICSARVGLLRGIFLLLDELEKQDYSVSKTIVLRYLLAIRALIDALPNHLFLMVGLTPVARERYFQMLPAFHGRFQNVTTLLPLSTAAEALRLCEFYVNEARKRATEDMRSHTGDAGTDEIISESDVQSIFDELFVAAGERGLEGVTQRDFLNELHKRAESKLRAG